MYEFASSSATLLTVYTAVMHTRRMNVIPEADLGTISCSSTRRSVSCSPNFNLLVPQPSRPFPVFLLQSPFFFLSFPFIIIIIIIDIFKVA